MQYGADLTATQAAINAKYQFPVVDRSKPIPMVVRTASGQFVSIADPAKQKEYIARSYTSATPLEDMTKGAASAKLPTGVIVAGLAAAALLFTMR